MSMPYILDLLGTLKTKVATNETNIATNTTNIAANKTSIDDHKKDDTRHWTTADRQNFDRVIHFKGYFVDKAALLAAHPTGQVGDYAIVGATDTVWTWDDTTNSWLNSNEQGVVISVNGKVGEVILSKTDVGLSNVDNTSDENKPISKAQQTALDNKANRGTITESEVDSMTLKAGVYSLVQDASSPITILGYSSSEWTVIVGDNGDATSPQSATQIWIGYSSASNEETHTFFRRQKSSTSWTEFSEIITNKQFDDVKTQVTTNKDDIKDLKSDKADRKTITLSEAGGTTLRAGTYSLKDSTTVKDLTANSWTVIVTEQVDNSNVATSVSQFWMPVDSTQDARIFYRKYGDGKWGDFIELITTKYITIDEINTLKQYKGYYATEADLKAAKPTGTSGDYALVEDVKIYAWSIVSNGWILCSGASEDVVNSVNGQTGDVVLTKASVGLGNVDNTADKDKDVNSAKTLTTTRKIDGVSFNGNADITHYGTCSTDAATAEKVVACTGFNLVTGAWVAVRFTTTNTAAVADLTLNVNNTGAKAIKYRNADLPTAGDLATDRTYLFVYDGTNYQWVGDRSAEQECKKYTDDSVAPKAQIIKAASEEEAITLSTQHPTNIYYWEGNEPSGGDTPAFDYDVVEEW